MLSNITKYDKFFSKSHVARVMTSAINKSDKTQVEIAKHIGVKPNVVTMFKQGRSPVPVARAKAIAEILGLPVHWFVRIVFEESHEELVKELEKVLVISKSQEEADLFLELRD